jgi:branched-chain amino acid aminotransferase
MQSVQTKDKGVPMLTDEGYAYFEGRIVPMGEAKVSVATHALHYGTGCFEGIRGYWNADHEQLYLLKMREHYQRLADSCNTLRMQPKESVDDLCQITIDLVRRHGYRSDVYVRPLVYKADCTIRLTLSQLTDSVAIYAFPMGNYIDISAGLKVCTSSWRRANSRRFR